MHAEDAQWALPAHARQFVLAEAPKPIEPSMPDHDAVDSDAMDAIRTPRTPNGQSLSAHAQPITIARRVPTPQPLLRRLASTARGPGSSARTGQPGDR